MFGLCGVMNTMCRFFIPRVLMISLLELNVAVAVKAIIGVTSYKPLVDAKSLSNCAIIIIIIRLEYSGHINMYWTTFSHNEPHLLQLQPDYLYMFLLSISLHLLLSNSASGLMKSNWYCPFIITSTVSLFIPVPMNPALSPLLVKLDTWSVIKDISGVIISAMVFSSSPLSLSKTIGKQP